FIGRSRRCLFHAPPPPDLYTLALHDALPISSRGGSGFDRRHAPGPAAGCDPGRGAECWARSRLPAAAPAIDPTGCPDMTQTSDVDRKSTRLNSSHVKISYAVFCLKKNRKTPP